MFATSWDTSEGEECEIKKKLHWTAKRLPRGKPKGNILIILPENNAGTGIIEQLSPLSKADMSEKICL